MVNIDTFKKMALAFPGTAEMPHFEKTSFRVGNKIFATLAIEENRACLKLTEIDQSVFCTYDKEVIFPVNNKWGKQGWTFVELKKVRKDMLQDALSKSYDLVISKKTSSNK